MCLCYSVLSFLIPLQNEQIVTEHGAQYQEMREIKAIEHVNHKIFQQ